MLSAIAFPAACAGAMALACEDAGEAAGGDCFAIALMLRPPLDDGRATTHRSGRWGAGQDSEI
jgi:hypothetical protein